MEKQETIRKGMEMRFTYVGVNTQLRVSKRIYIRYLMTPGFFPRIVLIGSVWVYIEFF